MEKGYWLVRKRASLTAARNAGCAQARLIHYDLAGRYALNAVSAETQAIHLLAEPSPAIFAIRHKAPARERRDA